MVAPATKRRAARHSTQAHPLSLRRACHLVGLHRSVWYRTSTRQDSHLSTELKALAEAHPRFGYRRLHVLLRRAGHQVNRKRVQRLYKAAELGLRKHRRKRMAVALRLPLCSPLAANQRWSMDFMSDQLANGRRFRGLNVVDDRTRECLAMVPAFSLTSEVVTAALDSIAADRGLPQAIVSDNGPEFTSLTMLGWAYRRQVKHQRIHPGKPVQNAFVESFNGRARDELFNAHLVEVFATSPG